MKNIILKILRTGYTTSKKYTVEDLCKYLHILRPLLKEECGMIICNKNAFWAYENNENRTQLINDIEAIHRNTIKDCMVFTILNRCANGDAYGIVKA